MKKALLILVAAATVSSGAYAQEFMNINPDARITAMGNAGIAATGGAYPTFNNPASPLFEYHSVQASFAYTLFAGEEFNKHRLMAVGGYVKLHERHALSVGARLFFEPRLADTGKRPDSKSFDLSYGYKIGRHVALAATVRYLHYNDGDKADANAIGFDLGLMSKIPVKIFDGSEVNIGAKLSNAGFWWGDRNCELPLAVTVGSALFLPIRDSHSLEVAVDMGYCISPKPARRFTANIGAEYTLMQLLKFRCGGNLSEKFSYGTIGCGIRFFHLQFDVAYSMAGRGNPMRNAVQLCVGLDF